MTNSRVKKSTTWLLSLTIIATILYTDIASAALEEIVVTARKREESLQDVPISISAVTGEKLQKQGIVDIESVAPSIPNFHHAQAVISSDIFILRGLGSAGSNVGFEQAVGQVYNGVFFGRSRFGRATFLDVERLEVLKGPQGALIGKNTSAGAINITSKKPTEEFEGYFIPSYDFQASEGYSVEGAVSGPLLDTLRGRFAFRHDDRDGWVDNNNTGTPEQTKDDITARLILDFDVTDTVNASFLYQLGDFERRGRNREWSACSAANAAAFTTAHTGASVPNALAGQDLNAADCSFDGQRSTLFVFNDELREEINDTRFNIVGLTLDFDLAPFLVTSLTNYSDYDVEDIWDLDQSIVQRTNIEWYEIFEQFSQEIRVTSDKGEAFDYMAGLYYQTTDIDYLSPQQFHRGPSSGQRNRESTQETQTWATFFQFDWSPIDEVTLTAGGRYTDESKDGVTSAWYSELHNPNNVLLAPGVIVPGFSGTTAEFGGNQNAGFATITQGPTIGDNVLRGTRDESNFSPNASLQWRFYDDQLLYLNFAKGFKSGGFDLQSTTNTVNNAAITSWQFGRETSTHWELGGKHTLANNTLRANWAVFRTEFDDMQVTALDGITQTQITTNAAKAVSQGVELELQWAPTDVFNLGLNTAYLNAEFDSFNNAPCWAGQTVALGCNPVDIDNDGATDGNVQDLSGVQLQFAPELQFTIDADYTLFFQNGMELTFASQYFWVDDKFLSLDHDPNDTQSSFGKINARISLISNDGQWSVALVGRNLTNEFTANFANDTTGLVSAPQAVGTHFKFLEETRAIGLQFRWNL